MSKMTENENRLSEGPGCRLVRIERIANNCWRAREWSAFLVCLLLPARGFRCYSREGQAVVELTDIGLSELRNRSLAENRSDSEVVFSIPFPGALSDGVFLSWKKKLSPALGE